MSVEVNSRGLVWMGRIEAHAFTTNRGGDRRQALCGVLPDERDRPMSRAKGRVCLECNAKRRRMPKLR